MQTEIKELQRRVDSLHIPPLPPNVTIFSERLEA